MIQAPAPVHQPAGLLDPSLTRRRRWTGEDLPKLDSPAPRVARLRVRAALPIGDGGLLAATATVLSSDRTVAACFLYQDSPTLDSTDVAEVFPPLPTLWLLAAPPRGPGWRSTGRTRRMKLPG